MTSKDFTDKLTKIAGNVPTVYGWGTFGWPWNRAALDRIAAQYPSYYTPDRKAKLAGFLEKGYFAFDCVGLIKAVLWGWTGDTARPYGGAVYASNGVPDIDANTMKNRCRDISTDFSRTQAILPGEIVWLQGHIGVYIGDGLAVECTPVWKDGVQVTAVANIGSKSGYTNRKWTCHGKLPWVEYGTENEERAAARLRLALVEARKIIDAALA